MIKTYKKMMINRKNVMPLIEILAKAYNEMDDSILKIDAAKEDALFVLLEEQQGDKE